MSSGSDPLGSSGGPFDHTPTPAWTLQGAAQTRAAAAQQARPPNRRNSAAASRPRPPSRRRRRRPGRRPAGSPRDRPAGRGQALDLPVRGEGPDRRSLRVRRAADADRRRPEDLRLLLLHPVERSPGGSEAGEHRGVPVHAAQADEPRHPGRAGPADQGRAAVLLLQRAVRAGCRPVRRTWRSASATGGRSRPRAPSTAWASGRRSTASTSPPPCRASPTSRA